MHFLLITKAYLVKHVGYVSRIQYLKYSEKKIEKVNWIYMLDSNKVASSRITL